MKNVRIKMIALAMACVMLGAGVTAGIYSNTATADNGEDAAAVTTVVTSPFTAAIAMVRSSVVGVNNYQMQRSNYGWGYGYGYGYGGRGGYGNNEPREVLYGTGSGVVIADGYVLTNYHVVEDAVSLKITVSHDDGSDPETLDAELVGYDKDVDIAILHCADLHLPAVALGDSDSLMVGDWAIVIGNPLSETFSGTVTAGIVSGLNRAISSSSKTDRYGRRTNATNTMIQIDAAINSGNSGGGMFSVTGELMGIPTLKYSSRNTSGASIESIGMCIPINSAKPLIEQVLSGKVTGTEAAKADDASSNAAIDMTGRPRMGLTMTALSSQNGSLSYSVRYASYYGMLPAGVYVTAVDEEGPAQQAGIQPGDIIVDLNGTVITSTSQIQQLVAAHKAGDVMQVKIYRVPGITELNDTTTIPDGEYIDLEVTLAVVDPVS